MVKPLLPDDLWAVIEPLRPPEQPTTRRGMPRIPGCAAFAGIRFIRNSGIPYRMLPPTLGHGSEITCPRFLADRRATGMWIAAHRAQLVRLGAADRVAWERAGPGRTSGPAKGGRAATVRTQTDRGRPGCTLQALTDTAGVPLPARVGPANRYDSTLLDAVFPINQPSGQRRQRPGTRRADSGYDDRRCRPACRRRLVKSRLARVGVEAKGRLGRDRRVVERPLTRLTRYRPLAVRHERR